MALLAVIWRPHSDSDARGIMLPLDWRNQIKKLAGPKSLILGE